MKRGKLVVSTQRGLQDVTQQVAEVVQGSGIEEGLCHLFIHHTSASLVIQENADVDVQIDLERFLSRLVVDGDPLFTHVDEGPDDMPAHVKAALTAASLVIPVENGRLSLGTWQGIYLWEHRSRGNSRRLTVTVW
jgi:secondary thiamine-phosphate synthase enzyme